MSHGTSRTRLASDPTVSDHVDVVIPTPSIRITLSLRVPAALSVEGFLLVRYGISGIAGTRCVKYRRLVPFIVY